MNDVMNDVINPADKTNQTEYLEDAVRVTLTTMIDGKILEKSILLLKNEVDYTHSTIGSLLHNHVADTLKQMLKKS